MVSDININWGSQNGYFEIDKISKYYNLKVPAVYNEQKVWAQKIIDKHGGVKNLEIASSDDMKFELYPAEPSFRESCGNIGDKPDFIPNISEGKTIFSSPINRFFLKNIKVMSLFDLGFVFFDNEDRIIEEISSQFYPLISLHPDIKSVLNNCEHFSSPATFIADWFFERNYAHWLLDTIPRLINKNSLVVSHVPDKAWQRELLKLYNVDTKSLITIKPNVCFSFKSIALDGNNSKPVPHPAYKGNRKAVEFVRTALKGIEKPVTSGRLALIVKRYDTRVIKNLSELEDILVRRGFIVQLVDCSHLTVEEQITCFSSADIVIGAHGAALANIIFCKESAHIYEIFPNSYGNPAFWAIANSVRCKYTAITDTVDIEDASKPPRYRDMILTKSCLQAITQKLAV